VEQEIVDQSAAAAAAATCSLSLTELRTGFLELD
jgi:hypothetical protein